MVRFSVIGCRILRDLMNHVGCSSEDTAKQVIFVRPNKELFVRLRSVLMYLTATSNESHGRLTFLWSEVI